MAAEEAPEDLPRTKRRPLLLRGRPWCSKAPRAGGTLPAAPASFTPGTRSGAPPQPRPGRTPKLPSGPAGVRPHSALLPGLRAPHALPDRRPVPRTSTWPPRPTLSLRHGSTAHQALALRLRAPAQAPPGPPPVRARHVLFPLPPSGPPKEETRVPPRGALDGP